jgi:hypothetical protein
MALGVERNAPLRISGHSVAFCSRTSRVHQAAYSRYAASARYKAIDQQGKNMIFLDTGYFQIYLDIHT